MSKPRCMGPLGISSLLAVVTAIVVACGNGEATATPFPLLQSTPTAQPVPTPTPVPTATPQPTATPVPVPVPTPTLAPTATPARASIRPYRTPTPLPPATPVPTPTVPFTPTTPPTATPEPTPTPEVTLEPTSVPTATPVATAAATPTSEATPTPLPTTPPVPTPTPSPTSTPVPSATVSPEPTIAPDLGSTTAQALRDTVDEFDFVLKLDREAIVRTAGWTGPEPNTRQGTLSFATGGVNANLIWGSQEGREPLVFLADTYNILRGSQPTLTFEPVTDGELAVSGEQGVYGAFRALDENESAIGGGLIGTWVCSGPQTAFRLTVTGTDSMVVQLRFDRLRHNFTCAS